MNDTSDQSQAEKPQLPSESDKRCAFVFDEGMPEARRCGGYHVTDSLYCIQHCEMAAEFAERSKAARRKRAVLADELMNEYHQLRSNQDCVLWIEKVINAINMRIITDTKVITMMSQMLAFLGQHIKGAKETPPEIGKPGHIVVTDQRITQISWQSEKDLDQFLQVADPRLQIQILDELHRAGRIKEKPAANLIDITPHDPTLESGLLSEQKPKKKHDWLTQLLEQPHGMYHAIQHTCLNCGKVSDTKSQKEECPS